MQLSRAYALLVVVFPATFAFLSLPCAPAKPSFLNRKSATRTNLFPVDPNVIADAVTSSGILIADATSAAADVVSAASAVVQQAVSPTDVAEATKSTDVLSAAPKVAQLATSVSSSSETIVSAKDPKPMEGAAGAALAVVSDAVEATKDAVKAVSAASDAVQDAIKDVKSDASSAVVAKLEAATKALDVDSNTISKDDAAVAKSAAEPLKDAVKDVVKVPSAPPTPKVIADEKVVLADATLNVKEAKEAVKEVVKALKSDNPVTAIKAVQDATLDRLFHEDEDALKLASDSLVAIKDIVKDETSPVQAEFIKKASVLIEEAKKAVAAEEDKFTKFRSMEGVTKDASNAVKLALESVQKAINSFST